MTTPLPPCGSLWIWRGNHYDVVGVFGNSIHIREIGSGISFYQTYCPNLDEWDEPSK